MVVWKFSSTMYGVLLKGDRNTRKHADQISYQIESNNPVDNSIDINVDDNDSFEMQVPRTNEQSDMKMTL